LECAFGLCPHVYTTYQVGY